jgi:ParB family chromosome partitioning protein
MFAQLETLGDDAVMRVAAFFMARSLQSGSDVVEDVGTRLAVDARAVWQPDDAFFDLVRDGATVNAIVSDVAGEAVAKANVAEKAKTQKQIVRDCLAGTNGRAKVTGWLPGWLEFPARGVGQGLSTAPVQDDAMEPERIAAE